MSRVWNFSAGPCALPVEVLEKARDQMLNYEGCGMGVMEMSHRSKEFVNIAQTAERDLRDILSIPDNYKVLFLQGGATGQFAAVPLNLMGDKKSADYLVTGQWGEKAYKECVKYYDASKACDTKPSKYTTIPDASTWNLDPNAAYLHYCMNETVNGVEFRDSPDAGSVPLVADMSSNFLSRPIDVAKHTLIYAGAQKNAGPAGLTYVIVRDDVLEKEAKICPTIMSYKTFAAADSMYNTPPCYAMYMSGLFLKHIKEKGGIDYWNEQSDAKSQLLYGTIDDSDGFYTAPVDKACRSRMNVPFQIQGGNEPLEKKFMDQAKQQGLTTLAGHRSVGGLRASIYNGMPLEGVQALVDFMKAFAQENQ